MGMERTLLIIKPDGVSRGLIGEIISRIERKGYMIEKMKMMQIGRELAEKHYAEHKDKPFFDELVSFITSGPVVVAVLAGEGCVAGFREMMGQTDPAKAAPGTIRGDFATEITRNIVHGSDSYESAKREIALFFPEDSFC